MDSVDGEEVSSFSRYDGELPAFANEEARAIHREIGVKQNALEKAQKEYDDQVERIGVMKEHLKNVHIEVKHTTGLLSSKKNEIQSENHVAQLALREAGRYEQEVRREQFEIEKHETLLNSLQNLVFEANEKMDSFKVKMNWNQEELEQWAIAAKQKEEDNLALQRYTKSDQVKINSLSLQIEKLNSLDVQKRVELENEKTETSARQVELDRTAEEFRALHQERQRLYHQWKESVEASHKRDQDIMVVAKEYAAEKKKTQDQKESILSFRNELEKAKEANADLESKALLMEKLVQTRRDSLTEEKERVQTVRDDIDLLKSELASSARTLARKRKENARAAQDVAKRKAHLERVQKGYHEARLRLEAGGNDTVKEEATAADAEKELRMAEQSYKARERKIAALKESLFKQSQSLHAMRQQEANDIAEISGAQAQARNLTSKIRQLDVESVRQRELVYNAEFQIQQMERKVSRNLGGEKSDAEKKVLSEKIAKLEAECEEAKETRKMLTAQCRRLGNELRAAERENALASQQQEDLRARITELDLENESAERDSKRRQIVQEEEAMVQNDMMRLELKRLKDALATRADSVFSLENRKQQLKLSMRERKQEIAVHSKVQAAQLRLADEERHKVQIEVGQRQQQVAKLAAKYEIICKSSRLRQADDDDAGSEPKSQAFYLIQAAQKREELQRQGDDLDQKIRRQEREMSALATTLNHLNELNSEFRTSHQRANMQSVEADQLRQLQDQAKVARDALFRRKKELQRLSTDFQQDEQRLGQVDGQCERLEERNSNLAEALEQMKVELGAQDESLEKVGKRLGRLSAMHREKLGTTQETVQEMAFRAQGLYESHLSVLDTLRELGSAYPETREVLNSLLEQAGLSQRGENDASRLAARH